MLIESAMTPDGFRFHCVSNPFLFFAWFTSTQHPMAAFCRGQETLCRPAFYGFARLLCSVCLKSFVDIQGWRTQTLGFNMADFVVIITEQRSCSLATGLQASCTK